MKARARVVAGPGGPYTAAVLRSDLPTVFLSLVQDRAAKPVADWIRTLAAARVSPAATS